MWGKLFRCLILSAAALSAFLILFVAYIALTPPRLDKVKLRDGDLVFQTNLDVQAIAIIAASHSVFTHMGMIKLRTGGPVVVEAIGPVTETPLDKWINRGLGKRISVMRVQDLKPGAAKKALARARKEYGKPYDIYFLDNDDAIYCSELVRLSYAGAGVKLGKTQKVGELTSSSAMDALIAERWQGYPLCRGVKGMTMEKCRDIIMKQALVTPASIARDAQVEPVYSNYPLD